LKKLSTGHDSTLENWIGLSTIVFGEESKAVKFLEKKAEDSPNGLQEQVIADERQLITLLANMCEV
jgi:hypothetical protein